MYAITFATLGDLPEVASWVRSAEECERWAGTQVTFPIDLAALPSTLGFTEQNAYAMTLDGAVVAFSQVVAKPKNRQHLAKFIVNPRFRGQGYGRAFLHELLKRTTADRISLNVNEGNDIAISLYVAAGFEFAERPPDQLALPRTHYMEWRGLRTARVDTHHSRLL